MKLPEPLTARRAQIPIVPLIDVVFLLLASFVVATLSMTMVKGMNVDLPAAAGEVNENDVVLIVVSGDNRIMLGGQEMTAAEAAVRASEQALAAGMPVVIRGDKSSHLGKTVALIDELKARGIKRLSFEVREK